MDDGASSTSILETDGERPSRELGDEAGGKAAAAARRPAPRAETKRRSMKTKKEDVLKVGQVIFYDHQHSGWILAKVTSVDLKGANDGGITYVIEAPQIDGVLETTREKLFTRMPDGA